MVATPWKSASRASFWSRVSDSAQPSRRSRFWAVHVDGRLLVVVVYRKGAEAIAAMLARAARKEERAA